MPLCAREKQFPATALSPSVHQENTVMFLFSLLPAVFCMVPWQQNSIVIWLSTESESPWSNLDYTIHMALMLCGPLELEWPCRIVPSSVERKQPSSPHNSCHRRQARTQRSMSWNCFSLSKPLVTPAASLQSSWLAVTLSSGNWLDHGLGAGIWKSEGPILKLFFLLLL